MAVDHWCKLIQFVLSHFCPLENPDSYNPEGQKNKAVRADFRLCGDWSGFRPSLLSPGLLFSPAYYPRTHVICYLGFSVDSPGI